jgi:hypothetical protein
MRGVQKTKTAPNNPRSPGLLELETGPAGKKPKPEALRFDATAGTGTGTAGCRRD